MLCALTVRRLKPGAFDGSLEDLRRSQQESDYASARARMDEYVEWTGTDGIFEVVIEQGR